MPGMRSNGFKLRQGRVRLDIGKNYFSERVVQRWHCCPGSGGVTSMEVFQSCGDVALRDVVWCHGGDGLGWDSVISVVSSNLNGSMIPWHVGERGQLKLKNVEDPLKLCT